MYCEFIDEEGWPLLGENNVYVDSPRASNEIMNYMYRINKIFTSSKEMDLVASWADENCIGPWLIGCFTSGFTRKEDALLFKLIWG